MTIWEFSKKFVSILLFVLVSVVFLPLLGIAHFGVTYYDKWWEKIKGF